MTVREVIRLIEDDGWRQVAQREAEGGRHAGSSPHDARRRNRVTRSRRRGYSPPYPLPVEETT